MSVSVVELWLAILIAGVLCWVASSLVHMLIKYHNADYAELPNEDEISAVLRASAAKPALYTIPHCKDMKAMGETSMQNKFDEGPVAMISILPNGMPPMGKLLGQQIVFFILGSLLIGYLASISLFAETDSVIVFKHVFVASFLSYGWAQVPYSIWMGQPWSNCLRYMIDAIIYACVTAATFAYLWPTAG